MPNWKPFAHLDTEKSALYREVLEVFVAAHASFHSHLRSRDLQAALPASASDELDRALDALVGWGNLRAYPDTAEVTTVEDFYRQRFLYQLSREGEAAERAITAYIEGVERTAELQSAALDDILALLQELPGPGAAADPARVHLLLSTIVERFNGLVEHARLFMAGLQRSIDLHKIEADSLLGYKERLIQYIERFLSQLVATSAAIAELLLRLGPEEQTALAEAAAARELSDRLDAGPLVRAELVRVWSGRLDGMKSWFLPTQGNPPQSEDLRRRAREAIPALLRAIAAHNERRISRTDRVADFRTLARWFADCESDDDAHRLWRAAFGLGPARHLVVDEATLEQWESGPCSASTKWADAPPLVLSPRLRSTGHHARRGRPNNVIDRGAERDFMRRRRAAELIALAEAERRIVSDGPIHLSTLGSLSEGAFALLLELLGEALSTSAREVISSDGRFLLRLGEPNPASIAVIETPSGRFSGPDFRVEIRRIGQGAA